MHATRTAKLTAADIDRLIAAKALPHGTHLANHPASHAAAPPPAFRTIAARQRDVSPAESFARRSAPAQALALQRHPHPVLDDAPHRWLSTEPGALGPARPAACLDDTDPTEPWHLPHMGHRANDAPRPPTLAASLTPDAMAARSAWSGRTRRPATPMAAPQDVRGLRGTAAPLSTFRDSAAPTQPPHPYRRASDRRAGHRHPGLASALANRVTQHVARMPWGWLLAGAAVVVLTIAASSLAPPWGWALPALEAAPQGNSAAPTQAATTGAPR